MTKVLWHWFHMGPYHFARMREVARQPGIELTVVETAGLDDHGWQRDQKDQSFRLVTLSTKTKSRTVHKETQADYARVLKEASPDIIIESGYGECFSRSALFEYRRSRPEMLVLMWSETTSWDHRRSGLREWLKRVIVSEFDGAIVAGSPHRLYMERLGMSSDRIEVVGGCVDNTYFESQANAVRAEPASRPHPRPYFLYVGRFVAQKNVPLLVRAYANYRRAAGAEAHDLVIVGSGPLEQEYQNVAESLNVPGIYFAGLKQVHELPAYYAWATCLVVPSKSEPWGLVVNEALASGVPVLASTRCGCAEDLIVKGVNGYVFDPDREDQLTECLNLIASPDCDRESMRRMAQERVQPFSAETFGTKTINHAKRLLSIKRTGNGRPAFRNPGRDLVYVAERLIQSL